MINLTCCLSGTVKTLFISTLIGVSACETKPKQEASLQERMVKQIGELKEMKAQENRIDSLSKATGVPLTISISIVENSIFPEDTLKGIALGFIEEDNGIDPRTLYTIKYDKATNKIISITQNEKEINANLYNPNELVP